MDKWMDILHQAQWKFHTQIMTTKKIHAAIYIYLTCQFGVCTMTRIGVQRWSLNRRMRACVTLCHSLCTAARSSAVFLGNGFIPLMRLDIYDHMLSIILISGPFAGHRRTSIAALARNPSLILAWRQLSLPMHNYQCVVHHGAWGCDQYISVQLSLRNVN